MVFLECRIISLCLALIITVDRTFANQRKIKKVTKEKKNFLKGGKYMSGREKLLQNEKKLCDKRLILELKYCVMTDILLLLLSTTRGTANTSKQWPLADCYVQPFGRAWIFF